MQMDWQTDAIAVGKYYEYDYNDNSNTYNFNMIDIIMWNAETTTVNLACI